MSCMSRVVSVCVELGEATFKWKTPRLCQCIFFNDDRHIALTSVVMKSLTRVMLNRYVTPY